MGGACRSGRERAAVIKRGPGDAHLCSNPSGSISNPSGLFCALPTALWWESRP